MARITHVLVDQQDGDILALLRVLVKCSFNDMVLGLVVDNEEVLLRFWGWRNMLDVRDQLEPP